MGPPHTFTLQKTHHKRSLCPLLCSHCIQTSCVHISQGLLPQSAMYCPLGSFPLPCLLLHQGSQVTSALCWFVMSSTSQRIVLRPGTWKIRARIWWHGFKETHRQPQGLLGGNYEMFMLTSHFPMGHAPYYWIQHMLFLAQLHWPSWRGIRLSL